MTDTSMTGMEDLLQGVFEQRGGPKAVLEWLLQRAMESQVQEHVKAARHQRTGERQGYRNGYKPRRLNTRVGPLELAVPQVRNAEPYHPTMFAKYQRHERALLVACSEMYYQGVSTRKVQAVLVELGADGLSAMTVSRIAAELDEQLAAFGQRTLGHQSFAYLMIDARYEKVRVNGQVVSQAVLVAVGFATDGTREILDFRLADSESEASWSELFKDLKARGLSGVELVISDAHQGIQAALKRHMQGAAWQRCRVHLKRELGRLVSYKVVKELMKDIASVYQPGEVQECRRRGQEMADKWRPRHEKVAALLETGLEDTLTCLGFPEEHRRRLSSTNLLENIMKQLKRRTKVIGAFPNRASCQRVVGAQLLELHEKWQAQSRVYFSWHT